MAHLIPVPNSTRETTQVFANHCRQSPPPACIPGCAPRSLAGFLVRHPNTLDVTPGGLGGESKLSALDAIIVAEELGRSAEHWRCVVMKDEFALNGRWGGDTSPSLPFTAPASALQLPPPRARNHSSSSLSRSRASTPALSPRAFADVITRLRGKRAAHVP